MIFLLPKVCKTILSSPDHHCDGIVQMASSPLLDPNSVSTLTLMVLNLETVATTPGPIYHVTLSKSMELLMSY